MRYYWKGIQHFFGANSRHGTHSPFVYRLADEVIYKPKGETSLGLAMPIGFTPFYTPLLADLLNFMQLTGVTSLTDSGKESAILVDFGKDTVESLLAALQKGSVLIVDEPFLDKGHERLWKELINNPATTVVMDLFHFGILLHREGQRKEYFRLRYPYWR